MSSHEAPRLRPHRTTETWRLLVGLPLMACAVCMLAAVYLYPRFIPPAIPVTGVEQPAPSAVQPTAPSARPAVPFAAPGTSYRSLAKDALDTCSSAFHDFFVLEELVARRPSMIDDSQFRDDSNQAMQAFRESCAKLAALPDAPSAFREVGGLLKQAAAEVAPATDGFAQMLDQNDPNLLPGSIEHMLKFVDYTHQAAALLSQMDDMKNI